MSFMGNIGQSMLSFTASIKTYLGCYHPQVTSIDITANVGKKEFSCGLTFVAISRVRCLKDLLLNPPFSFQRLKNLA